jgi:hypothetical protein
MTDIFEVLGWLEAIDRRSHLSEEARRLAGYARANLVDESRLIPILERLRNAAQCSEGPLAKAETFLHCAAIEYCRGRYPWAARDAREAALSYDADVHRHAVALWVLGSIQWKTRQNHDAYRNWADAREIFRKREPLFQHFPKEKSWYQNRVRYMEIKSAMRSEEIWTWLNYFEPSNLRTPTKQFVDRVQEKIRQQAYSNVYALMQDLQEADRRSETLYEKAENYLEFGLAMYQMGNVYYAIELLRKSVRYFHPGVGTYHKQVVARCMLGALEWMQRASHDQAKADWMRCIDEFEKLRGLADRDNCQDKEKWYARQRDILRVALFEKCNEEPKPPNPESGIPEEPQPEPPPWTPTNQKPDLYNELLMKVRWDRAIADRLIEFERKKAPTADRNEWIKRAIERWDHDNR